MKCFAITVTPSGDSNMTVIGLVKIDQLHLDTLGKLRRMVDNLSMQLKGLHKSFACLTLWSTDINWLIVDHAEEADEATGKIYEKLCDSPDGFLEIPEEVYESRVRRHTELYQSADGGGMLRTETDHVRLNEKGLYFTCEEKHCYAQYETHMITWSAIFDET